MLLNRGTNLIETERLILRRFIESDANAFYNNVGSDDAVTKYVTWNKHKSLDVTNKAVNQWIENYKNNNNYYWVVELKENKDVIGSVSCVNVDIKNETCELGCVISSKYWNMGFATEILKAVINYLKDEGFKTIYAEHLGLNPASGKAMVKAGMTFEGILKNRVIDKNTGKYDDLLSYSIVIDKNK